jgi:hypothetical protein
MEAGQGRTSLVFPLAPEGSAAPVIRINFEPARRTGVINAGISLGSNEPARFWIFIFP